jgi:uncharacterized membrane protein YbhN (UPF0104 family)
VREFLHATAVFFQHLTEIHWRALAVAIALHLFRLFLRSVAWRNILAASYPNERVRLRSAFGAYMAGVGVNSITPARGGDVLKVFLIKRSIESSSYATVAATLIVETLFDLVVAGGLFIWAISLGVLPGLNVIPDLPSVDWSWPLRHRRISEIVGVILLAVLITVGIWALRRFREFRDRVRVGFAILREPARYGLQVVVPQAASWVLRLASTYEFMRAFGLRPSWHDALLVQVAASLSTLLPISPGGAGTQQGLLVYLFKGKGISKAALLSFSVGMNLTLTVVNGVVGFTCIGIMLRTFHWRAAVEPEEGATPG